VSAELVRTGQVSMTETSWQADPAMSYDEWVDQGRRLGVMGRACQWWIGDWINHGERAYGERYTQAVEETGLDTQTLMNCAWVAASVAPSLRVERLSWSHHREVAALDDDAKQRWLAVAEEEELPVAKLAARIKADQPTAPTPTDATEVLPAWRTTITLVHEAASDDDAAAVVRQLAAKLERSGFTVRHKTTVPA
jgi:hypothetical protein